MCVWLLINSRRAVGLPGPAHSHIQTQARTLFEVELWHLLLARAYEVIICGTYEDVTGWSFGSRVT